jgi:hypothetical protein
LVAGESLLAFSGGGSSVFGVSPDDERRLVYLPIVRCAEIAATCPTEIPSVDAIEKRSAPSSSISTTRRRCSAVTRAFTKLSDPVVLGLVVLGKSNRSAGTPPARFPRIQPDRNRSHSSRSTRIVTKTRLHTRLPLGLVTFRRGMFFQVLRAARLKFVT